MVIARLKKKAAEVKDLSKKVLEKVRSS